MRITLLRSRDVAVLYSTGQRRVGCLTRCETARARPKIADTRLVRSDPNVITELDIYLVAGRSF